MAETFVIDCDECVMRDTPACRDCVVTALFREDPHDALVLDAAEFSALRLLNEAGLAPALRHRRPW
jgi:hypothetical protein